MFPPQPQEALERLLGALFNLDSRERVASALQKLNDVAARYRDYGGFGYEPSRRSVRALVSEIIGE
jgi:hypothetical protein